MVREALPARCIPRQVRVIAGFAVQGRAVDFDYRNLNHFYLLAHHIAERPPRIHRLVPLVEKLETYEMKFADLARRISVRSPLCHLPTLSHREAQLSHERLHALDLRAAHGAEGSRKEGRARRTAIREELRRVRGTIRAIRQRGVRDENEGLHAEGDAYRGRERRKWKIG